MDLSVGVRASISEAQKFAVKGGSKDLCIEHVLYGLLMLSRYLDPPLNRPELQKEGKEVRALLSDYIGSIESAAWVLGNQAHALGFNSAATAIGRASEIAEHAGKREIDAVSLAKAVMESPTPGIRDLMAVRLEECAARDEKYKRAAEPDMEEPNEEISTSQLAAMLAFLAGLANNQHESLKYGSQKQKGGRLKRYTKVGLFTYRGGTVAAAIQYFLFGLLVPLALLFGLDRLTGIITAPQTPFASFGAYTLIVLWLFYLAKGVSKLVGLKSKSFGHFLDILVVSALCVALARGGLLAYGVADTPTWLRAVLCVVLFLVLSVGGGMFPHLADQGDPAKTKIMFQNVKGTPGMIFFRFFTRELITPLVFFAVIWIFRIAIPLWLEKVFYICAFLWAWNIVYTMWSCVKLRYENTIRVHRGEGLFRFLAAQHGLLLAPGLGLYLHWLFGWFPMQTWVIVVYCAYGFIWLVASIGSIKMLRTPAGSEDVFDDRQIR